MMGAALLALTMLAGPAPDEAALSRPGLGEPAPAFEAASTTGAALSLASFRGKKTLVLAFFHKAFTAG